MMKIGIAGPYSADTESQRQQNLDALNQLAASVFLKGHIPLVGVNAALPIIRHLEEGARYEAIMSISLAIIDSCDALLIITESPGANRERDAIARKGLPIYTDINQIPILSKHT